MQREEDTRQQGSQRDTPDLLLLLHQQDALRRQQRVLQRLLRQARLASSEDDEEDTSDAEGTQRLIGTSDRGPRLGAGSATSHERLPTGAAAQLIPGPWGAHQRRSLRVLKPGAQSEASGASESPLTRQQQKQQKQHLRRQAQQQHQHPLQQPQCSSEGTQNFTSGAALHEETAVRGGSPGSPSSQRQQHHRHQHQPLQPASSALHATAQQQHQQQGQQKQQQQQQQQQLQQPLRASPPQASVPRLHTAGEILQLLRPSAAAERARQQLHLAVGVPVYTLGLYCVQLMGGSVLCRAPSPSALQRRPLPYSGHCSSSSPHGSGSICGSSSSGSGSTSRTAPGTGGPLGMEGRLTVESQAACEWCNLQRFGCRDGTVALLRNTLLMEDVGGLLLHAKRRRLQRPALPAEAAATR